MVIIGENESGKTALNLNHRVERGNKARGLRQERGANLNHRVERVYHQPSTTEVERILIIELKAPVTYPYPKSQAP